MIQNQTQTQNQNQKTDYQSPAIGQEICCVMKNINREFFNDCNKLKELLIKILEQDNFKILKIETYKFEPQGFTIFILLAESHLAVHTYPEHNSLYFSLYSCRGPKDAEKTFEKIKNILAPESIFYLKKDEIPVRG